MSQFAETEKSVVDVQKEHARFIKPLGDWRRSHNCGQLTLQEDGQTVCLMGWVQYRRDHGGLIFVDLRDHYGVTQIVFSDDSMIAGMSKETVVLVEGVVSKRDEDTVNPKIATGLVEVRAEKIEVLGPCQLGLPFEIDASTLTREEVQAVVDGIVAELEAQGIVIKK